MAWPGGWTRGGAGRWGAWWWGWGTRRGAFWNIVTGRYEFYQWMTRRRWRIVTGWYPLNLWVTWPGGARRRTRTTAANISVSQTIWE